VTSGERHAEASWLRAMSAVDAPCWSTAAATEVPIVVAIDSVGRKT
jgi:hypothetical protein